MTQVYRQLALLTHPDKQTPDWKQKATKAHSSKQRILTKGRKTNHKTVLNDARDKFDLSTDTPEEIERPKQSHKNFWDTTPFVGSIRRLQIDPSNQKALAFVEKVNSDIEAHNKEKGYNPGRRKFPLKYLQDKYQNTQALRKTYKDMTDPEQKRSWPPSFRLSASQLRNSAMTVACLRRGLGNMLISIRSLHGFQKPRNPRLVLLMVLVIILALAMILARNLALVMVLLLSLALATRLVLAMARTRT